MAYDQAAMMICGERAKLNFQHTLNSKFLSSTLMAKLQKCYKTSLETTNSHLRFGVSEKTSELSKTRAKRCAAAEEEEEDRCRRAKRMKGVSSCGNEEAFEEMSDDHIEQMIEELLGYGSIEI